MIIGYLASKYMGLDARKPVFGGVVNNKGADQPAHPRGLSAPLLLAYWKVSYLDLLGAKFQFSS